jgi:hypothetical protein
VEQLDVDRLVGRAARLLVQEFVLQQVAVTEVELNLLAYLRRVVGLLLVIVARLDVATVELVAIVRVAASVVVVAVPLAAEA